jgi:immune inhibitor A
LSNKKFIMVVGLLVFVLLCCAGMIGVGAWQVSRILNDSNLVAALEELASTVTPTPIPRIDRTPVVTPIPPTTQAIPSASAESGSATPEAGEGGQASPLQPSTEQLLTQAILPERDQRLLAMRLKHRGREIPEVARETPYDFQLGDSNTFWVTDNQQTPPLQFEVTASVKYITEHAYWWVQESFQVDEDALQRSAERFENETYPTNRAFFGSEWSPGVDSDVHVNIFMGNVPGVAGYFSASNEYSKLAETYSNEREMFFINLNAIRPGNDYFDGVLAHEFQHMIHWYQDRNEETWVNEGLSELATFINGYGSSNFVGAYSATPDTQLTAWADNPNAASANYGAGFLFMAYFLQRYGEEMTQAVVANPQNGIAGFNAVLAERGFAERFDDIFADFLVANYLQDPAVGAGQWGYTNLTPGPATLAERYSVYPQNKQATVYQYGADYIELTGQGSVAIEFTGSTRVKVVDNDAHSGNYQWYSHRGDDSNTHLTRAFDLRDVSWATLNYWTWYDIEEDWDYGYVEISTDGGETWTILQSPHSATDNPSGNAYGPGYTGPSGDGGPTWLEESIDLSAYTGQEVLIRFEYVTDDAVNHPGWTIDDISIPEIDFYDDAESGPGDWQAAGFVRIDNVLPQRFLAQVLETGDEIEVKQIPLDETNSGTFTVTGLGDTLDQAILIVSGLTPVTTQPASYEYKLVAIE